MGISETASEDVLLRIFVRVLAVCAVAIGYHSGCALNGVVAVVGGYHSGCALNVVVAVAGGYHWGCALNGPLLG